MTAGAELPGALWAAAATWAALAGAAVGSFLNVVIARVPAGESIVRPRSRCPRCRTPIAWYDNVPLLSWLVLRGRCRACGERISPRYPLVEAAGAALGVVAFLRHGASGAAFAEFGFTATLLALAAIDLDTWLLPHALTWPLLAAGLLLSAAGVTPAAGLKPSAWGAGIGFAAFAAISVGAEKLLGKEAMGFGDVWLLAGLGAWLGIAALLPIVLLASVQGSVVGIALVLLGKAQKGPASDRASRDDDWVPPRHAVPFGPFLVLGAVEWLWASGAIASAVPALELFR